MCGRLLDDSIFLAGVQGGWEERERAFNGSGSRAVEVWLRVAGDEDLFGDDII